MTDAVQLDFAARPSFGFRPAVPPSDSKCVFSRAHSTLSPRFSTVFQKESKPDI
jgi:hypothetical protein